MESKTEIDFSQAKSANDAAIYRAVGWIAGRYQPSEEDVHRGIFLTEDGLSVPAQMTGQLRGRLKRRHPDYATQPDFFTQDFWWIVYPKTEPLRFEMRAMKPISADPTARPELDEFCVVGKVKSIESDVIIIRIQRNQPPRWGGKKASFKLTFAGSLPEIALGQIWELKVRREGEKLTVVDGQPYQPSAEDLVWLEQQRQATVHSNLSAPTLKQQSPNQMEEDTTIAAPTSPAVTPELEESIETPDVPPPDAIGGGAQATMGKMEVVVKLNQFPDEVKTVDKGWKEFEVDTGDRLVTITVKPKAFALLEQAQQSYPSWVAAISGLMGESTAKGFRLESPAIKVFERKAKDTQTESTKTLNNLEPSPDTSPQPPSPAQTPAQQQAQPKPESPPQALPVANPMQRVKEPLKQQRPSKTPSHQLQHQRHQPAFGKKPATPTPQTSQESRKPSFSVKVNDRVFNGYESVTLNKRVICVDGKPVAQSKMAVVVGQPKTMQADGGVTQGSNQAVLISK